jgi:Lipocalin-like domain
MKRLKPILAILLFSSLCFIACKKSSTHVKTNTELITQTSWKFDNATVSGVDVSAFLEACETDNILVFTSTGTGTVDEGATKCNSGDPQTNPFTWNFTTNETVLHVSTVLFSGGSSDFNIVTLSETQLVLSQNIDVSGSTQNAVVTFTH